VRGHFPTAVGAGEKWWRQRIRIWPDRLRARAGIPFAFAPHVIALGGTTMSHKLLLACTVFLALPGCEAIGNIFQAGIWTGVIGVVVVVALIIFLITRMRG